MIIDVASFSEIGPRFSNQDRVLLPSSNEGVRFLAAIADGIGGASGGAEAAQLAVDAAASFSAAASDMPAIFSLTVDRIRATVDNDAEMLKMGTTLSVVLIESNIVHVAHVGDCRVYHLRRSGLNTLTDDQTEVAELLRRGTLNDRQAKRYPRRNVLLSALSAKGAYDIQLAEAKLEKGDRILLLTDGAYQRATRGSILNLSIASLSVDDFCENLKNKISASRPSDNFSGIFIEIGI